MVKKRQSVSTRKPSIIEEHQNIKISIKQLNDKFETLDYEDVFESESDLEIDDHYVVSTCDLYNTIFLKEKDDDLFEGLFETNEYGIYKRSFEKDQQIIKTILSCHDDIITASNIIQVYLKANKKMLTTCNEQLPLKTFNRIIIFYGLTRSSYEFLPWEKCADFDALMKKNDLGLDFDRLEFDFSINKLIFKKDMTRGEFLTLGQTVNVRRLEDISLMEMGLRCGHCNSHLKLRNVSLKVKGTHKEFKSAENTKEDEMIKCDECAVCYCDALCKEKDTAIHKELYHPSLKYKPNKTLDGKKFKTLLNFLLSKNMETVYTLLTSKTELLNYPVFEVNYANVAILHENNHEDLFKAFELYKNVFYPLCDEYTYQRFLMELGARYLLNVVVDLKNHNPTLNDDHLLSPMLIFLEHTSTDANVELNMKENKLVLKQSVKKGETVKFNLYKSIQRHFSNVETQCSEYTLMKSHLGINIKDNDNVIRANNRRKSSVRFLDKVTAFNIN